MKILTLLTIFTLNLIASESFSLYDSPKYSEHFSHFDYRKPDAPKGGDIVLGVSGTFDSFNQYILKGIPADNIELIYDSLMVKSDDEVSSYYGLLAEDVNISEDYKTVIFTIRDEATFSDGVQVSAYDVKFTFETLLKDGSPAYKNYLSGIKNIEVLDELKIKFEFSENSNRDMVSTVATIEIIPKHFWDDKSFKESSLETPIGSGAYKIESFRAGHSIKFVRNKDYWGKNLAVNRGKYNFDSIRYDYYRDENVLFEAFKSLNYHFRQENISKNWATEYQDLGEEFIVEEIKNSLPQGIQGFFFNIRKDKFKDLRIRKAIALAFDFEWTNKNLFYNQYKRSESFFSNSDFDSKKFHLPKAGGSYEIRPHLRESMRLLKEAGCYLKNGKLYLKNGKQLKFEITLVSTGFVKVVLPFKKNLAKLGIEMNIKLIDISQYIQRLRKFDFDMVVSSRSQALIVGGEQSIYWHSKGANIKGSMNIVGVENPKIDKAIENINISKNLKELKKYVFQLDEELLKNFYVIPHWHIDKFRVSYWRKIHRFKNSPAYGLDFNGWWFER